jgi:transcription-repair coupling factor (superfamily II helicase)
MLSEAVRALKNGEEPDLLSPLNVTTEINLHAPALLPDDYCGDVHLRLSFYKKLATAKTQDQVDALLEELVDRFGKLPSQAQTLIDTHRLRVLARPFGVAKVDAAPGVILISFKAHAPIDGMRIIQLVQKVWVNLQPLELLRPLLTQLLMHCLHLALPTLIFQLRLSKYSRH